MDKRNIRIKTNVSLAFNFTIITATIVGLILAYFDAKAMGHTYDEVFKYYTTLSNLFLFASAVLMVVFNFRLLYKKDKPIPKWLSIFKICATTTTTITMLTVICFLTPVAILKPTEEFTAAFLYSGSNCIFHVISPVLGIITLLFFESKHDIEFPHVTFTVVFTGLYEIYYATGIYMHPDELEKYDWYRFAQTFGMQYVVPMLLVFLALSFLIGWLLWLGNRKIHVLESKKQVTTK